jgi:hypothetical protein
MCVLGVQEPPEHRTINLASPIYLHDTSHEVSLLGRKRGEIPLVFPSRDKEREAAVEL